MLFLLAFCLFINIQSAVLATEVCDFELYRNCVEEDGQSATEKCFIDAGCKVQHFNETNVMKGLGHECRWIIVEKIRDEIQKCVQEKYPKYHLKLHKRQHIKPDCPKSVTPNCTRVVVKEKACDKHKLCLARLSPECQTQFQDARKAVCTCANDHLEKRRDELAKHLSMCGGNWTTGAEKGKGKGKPKNGETSTQLEESPSKGKGHGKGKGHAEGKSHAEGKGHSEGKGHGEGKSHHGKFDVVSFIKRLYCETKLPCEN